tara:strand:+ start:259 stop:771 length:513 start_codon:yes stop_codon:yes gene_type:complete
MALIKSLNNKTPIISEKTFCAESSTIIGDVEIDEYSSLWYNTVIRGDVGSVRIGKAVNVQDGVVVHTTFNKSKTIIENHVTIGHNAVIHGCQIKENCLIGMGSIILDNSLINSNIIIGAGSVVLENSILDSGYLYAGVPVKKIKKLTLKQVNDIKKSAINYIKYSALLNR